MTIEIRRAGRGDLAAMLELVEDYCDADGHRFDAGRAAAGIEPLLTAERHGVIWFAHDDGSPEGYAVVTWGWSIEIGGLDVVLDELYVRQRRRGTGSRLIAELEADCSARGARRIFLETERPNVDARRLYARHGYRADSSIWMSKELS